MANASIDRRVIRILRWSIIVQIIFLILSSFSPRFSLRDNYFQIDAVDLLSFATIILMAAVLIVISFKKVEQRITKKVFLFILYFIALITILSRHIFSYSLLRLIPDKAPALFRWDAIFFLIIPLVFIAWQFTLKDVFTYCLVILVVDFVPTFFQQDKYVVVIKSDSYPPDNDIYMKEVFFLFADFMGSFARSVILGIVGWIENSLVTLQRSQHDQLVEANRKLQKYALTSEKLAQTQERNRLARELHDTLAHTLSSTSVQLEAIKTLFDHNPDQAKVLLDQTLDNTKNGLSETRRALVDLRSSELEAYGLTQAIRNTMLSASERGGFKVKFHMDKGLDILPDEISHCLYRIVQEAAENILRHSNASKVTVNLLSKNDEITLTIKDNGKGFDPGKIKKGNLGIRGMRERTEMLGGKFKIASEKKTGTEINVRIKTEYD